MELPGTQLVEAYRAADLAEAHTIRIALEDRGFRVAIDGESLQGGEYPLGWSTAPRILVAEPQLAAAREIIVGAHIRSTANVSETEQAESLRCLACGQLMESADKCSECGWTYNELAEI